MPPVFLSPFLFHLQQRKPGESRQKNLYVDQKKQTLISQVWSNPNKKQEMTYKRNGDCFGAVCRIQQCWSQISSRALQWVSQCVKARRKHTSLNLPVSKCMLLLLSKTDQCAIKWSFCHALEVYNQFDLRYVARFPNVSSVCSCWGGGNRNGLYKPSPYIYLWMISLIRKWSWKNQYANKILVTNLD